MATRQSPRTSRKRLRQSTLTNLTGSPDADGKKRHKADLNGTWDTSSKGIMIFEPGSWKADNYASLRTAPSLKIAAFDLDSTLITTKSRGKFPKSATDWRLLNSLVAPNIEELNRQGYTFVIFTNQAGVSNGRITDDFVKSRIEGILMALKVDMGVFVATAKDNFRKPGTGMWELFVHMLGDVDRIDAKSSFYVGDAAGRPARPGRPKDFSDSDLRFSINIGLQFRTPEEHLYNATEEAVSTEVLSGFDPRKLVTEESANFITEQTDLDAVLREIVTPAELVDEVLLGSSYEGQQPSEQILVLLHGSPASGKTTFAKRHLVPKGFVWINQDSMQTFTRCSRSTKDAFASGKSVVIDNTNPDECARQKYIELGRAHNPHLPVICLCMQTEPDVAKHLNVVRERESQGAYPHVPIVAFHAYSKLAQRPDVSEGIDRVGEVRFVPRFSSEHEKYMFTRLT